MSIIGDILGYFQHQEDMAFSDYQARQQRAFEHDEAKLAYERELSADASKYQRQVADMQAAGINPMMAVSAGAGSVRSASASGVAASTPSAPGFSGPNLGALLNSVLGFKQLKIQKEVADAEVQLKEAQAAKVQSETEGKTLENTLFADTMELKKVLLGDEHERNAWEKELGFRGVKVKEDNQRMLEQNAEHYNNMLDAQYDLISQQSLSEVCKRELYRANARESAANATYKVAMLECDKALTEAKTDTEKQQYELLKIEARFKEGVYTPAYIKAVCDEAKAQAEYKSIMADYMKGDYHRASENLQKIFKLLEKAGTAPNLFGLTPTSFISNEAKVLPALNH